MPYDEIGRRFRKSELALTAWRTSERAVSMDKKFKTPKLPSLQAPKLAGKKRMGGNVPAGLPDSCFNKDGEPDMSLMTSAQAIRVLRSAGFNLVAPPHIEREIEALGDEEIGFDPKLTLEKPTKLKIGGTELTYD